MAVYCKNCGLAVDENTNFCPQCGASIYGDTAAAYNDGSYNNVNGEKSGWSNAAKTAAVVGGVVVGASALSNLARRMTHRRRPPYMPPMGGPPPMGRPGMRGPGMGGPGMGF